METDESLEFGSVPPEHPLARRLLQAGAAGALLVAMAAGWHHNQQHSQAAPNVKPPGRPVQQANKPASIGGRNQQIFFTALGSYWGARNGSRLVSTEFSGINCRHGRIRADVFVGVDDKQAFLFENRRLPTNSLSLACLLTGEVNETSSTLSIGGSGYRYAVTDARPPVPVLASE